MAAKKIKMGNVPNLRFPGFEGEWEMKKLGEFIDIISGIPLQSEDISEIESETPILRGINVTEGIVRHSKEIDRYYLGVITDSIHNYLLKENDLVIGMDGSKVGKNVALIPKFDVGAILIQRVARIRATKKANINFIFQKISSSEFRSYVDVVNTSSGIPHISLQQIKDFKTEFPKNLDEQKRIANFLSLIDLRISSQSKIIKSLESSMRGLREKLFTQEIRLKDINGTEFPDWEEKKLNELAKKQIFKNKDLFIKSVLTNSAIFGIIAQRDFFDKDIANKNNINGYYIVKKNDFVYNPRISNEAPVGPISRNKICTGIMSPLYTVFRFNKGNLDFIEQYFKTVIWHIHMGNISNFGARADRMSFSGNDFFKMPIPVPCSEEQRLIAKLLLLFSEKISVEKSLLCTYQKQKKFLLQNLCI